MWMFFFFFFFQAEDGIRDWSVTGVQTCALPIWPVTGSGGGSGTSSGGIPSWVWIAVVVGVIVVIGAVMLSRRRSDDDERSEERRVGKECRSGWGRSDGKKKKIYG